MVPLPAAFANPGHSIPTRVASSVILAPVRVAVLPANSLSSLDGTSEMARSFGSDATAGGHSGGSADGFI